MSAAGFCRGVQQAKLINMRRFALMLEEKAVGGVSAADVRKRRNAAASALLSCTRGFCRSAR